MSALAATGEICPFTLILRSSATRTSHEPMRFILIRLCEANGSGVREQAALLPGSGGRVRAIGSLDVAASCAGLTRASIVFAKRFCRRGIDRRVKPGDDGGGIMLADSGEPPSRTLGRPHPSAG